MASLFLYGAKMNLELLAKDLGESVAAKLSPIRKAISEIAGSIINLDARLKELESRKPEVVEGQKGEKGDPGKDADPVEITHDDILTALKSDPSLLRDVVAEYLKDNPPPAGERGEKGEKGDKGDSGERGEKGADGVGATGAMIDKDGQLIVTLGNGELQRCGHVVGKDGEPGRDGVDLSDVAFEYDGERTISVKAKGGEVVSKYVMPVLIDKGYWRKGDVASKGDCYTRDGGLWISLQDSNTVEPSGQAKEHWRLGVRKGRDGRNGKDGLPPTVPLSK